MWSTAFFSFLLTATGLASVSDAKEPFRNLMYLTGQHPDVPNVAALKTVSHVALAFMNSDRFNDPNGDQRSEWPLFTTVEKTRKQFAPGTKVLVAIGGWGDTAGFEKAALSTASRALFARNIATMVKATGADGIDLDWEYPGGNGEDYKQVPNEQKAWQIEAYPLLLAEIRAALGPRKLITAAVPGKTEDMLAFTRLTVPRIMNKVDFLNVMSYDLMNRRDNVTKHHTGVVDSLAAVDAYIAAGVVPQKLNLGLAFYVKFFKTEHEDCLRRIQLGQSPIGCRTLLMEDPKTGADLGRTGGFSWHDGIPDNVKTSFAKARSNGMYDPEGGYYYWDQDEDLWWTYETAECISKWKFPLVIKERGLGGVFAWGLGEDGPAFEHVQEVDRCVEEIRKGGWDFWRGEL